MKTLTKSLPNSITSQQAAPITLARIAVLAELGYADSVVNIAIDRMWRDERAWVERKMAARAETLAVKVLA